ncbi:MAG: hypothetical protein WD906_05755 [Anaerolineales bacterium]
MTTPQEVFRRIRGEGWLVLAGGAPQLGRPYPHLAEHLLRYTDLSQPCRILVSGASTRDQDQFLEDVDVLLDSNVRVEAVKTIAPGPDLGSGLLALLGGDSGSWLAAIESKNLDGSLLDTLTEGGVVLAAPEASECFGSWVFPSVSGEASPGLGWLPGAAVIPGPIDPVNDERVRRLLDDHEKVYALGLPTSAILALGPGGQVEAWGEAPPRVTLGKGWA